MTSFLLLALLITSGWSQAQRKARRPPPTVTPATQPTSADEQALVNLETRILEAIRDKNATALEPVIAEDFQHVTATGETHDRARFLKDIASMPVEIEWLSFDQMRVRVFGHLAVVTGVQQAKARQANGSLAEGRDAFTDVFRRTGSDWELVMVYSVELPSTVTPGPPASRPITPVEKAKPPR